MTKVYALRRGIPCSGQAARTLKEMMIEDRLCAKATCSREAVATVTFDYGDQMAAVGPLGVTTHPQAHDLCASHTERVSVPAGWIIVRHEALRA